MVVFVVLEDVLLYYLLFLKVYEHVYKTVESSGSQDARATATAKATVAAFAASEGQGHPRIVELEKVGHHTTVVHKLGHHVLHNYCSICCNNTYA